MLRSLKPALLMLSIASGMWGLRGAAAQNLLSWSAWRPWNAQYVTQLSIDPNTISFSPYDPTWPFGTTCGLEQDVAVPADGLYQLHFQGAGGVTGFFEASWSIGGNERHFDGRHRQMAWSCWLTAGTHTLRFTTDTSNQAVDRWAFDQPILRPVVPPAIDLDLEGSVTGYLLPWASVFTPAHVLAMAPQRQASPLVVPGLGHGLELAPLSQIVVVTTSPNAWIGFALPPLSLFGQSWPGFYLQAISLEAPASFGSRLYVAPWQF